MADVHRPLPLRPTPETAWGDHRRIRFDREDPRWHEPLVDLAAEGLVVDAWYARRDGANEPYNRPIAGAIETVYARRSVATLLKAADRSLAPLGLRLKIVDAWRPVETQAGLWAFFWDKLARENPELDEAGLEALVRTFVSDPRRFDPDDDTTWPIHSTGGSVDVMLVDAASGVMLDHGAGFDEAHERSFTDHYERLLAEGAIGPEDPRLTNRRILVNAMVNAGFTNYVYEFWHFDYGTQLHVLTRRVWGEADPERAWYGTTRP